MGTFEELLVKSPLYPDFNTKKFFDSSPTLNISSNQLSKRLKGVERDHRIPKVLVSNHPIMKPILNEIDNLQMIHKHCHKVKSLKLDAFNRQYRPLIKEIMTTNNVERATAICLATVGCQENKVFNQLIQSTQDRRTLKKLTDNAQRYIKELNLSKWIKPKKDFIVLLKNS
jgi:hypothetical protein